MSRRNYIAIRILLCVAENVAEYGFKTEIERLSRDLKKLLEEELAETTNPMIKVVENA